MLDFLSEIGVPTIIVLTKIDKLTAKQRAERIFTITRDLALDADQVIPFSAVTGEGRNDLAEAVENLLAQPSWRATTADAGPGQESLHNESTRDSAPSDETASA
jgi:GTP-binding protein